METGTPPKSIQEFWDDPSFIRVLLGGRGSGKPFGLASDIVAHCWQNAGAKAIVARESEISQQDSSIDTFQLYFESLASPLYETDGLGLFKTCNNGRTFLVPSMLAVQTMQEKCKGFDKAARDRWIAEDGDRLCG